MVVKQKNLRVFHLVIDDVPSFKLYYKKNRIILKEFFLLLEGLEDKEIDSMLEADGVCFKYINGYNLKLSSVKKESSEEKVKEEEKTEEKTLFDKPLEEEKPKKSIITFNRPIRSGEEIHEELPVSVFGRINSGAKLFCSQSVTIFGEIDGVVQCDGEYLICSAITHRGHVIFNGEIVDKDIFKESGLKKIEMKNSVLSVKGIVL